MRVLERRVLCGERRAEAQGSGVKHESAVQQDIGNVMASFVIPAQAGIQTHRTCWIPTFVGMTVERIVRCFNVFRQTMTWPCAVQRHEQCFTEWCLRSCLPSDTSKCP